MERERQGCCEVTEGIGPSELSLAEDHCSGCRGFLLRNDPQLIGMAVWFHPLPAESWRKTLQGAARVRSPCKPFGKMKN